MEKQGATDLTDPVQCAAVAIDYIRELSLTFGWVDNHPLYLAYNSGPAGASRLNQIGVYCIWRNWPGRTARKEESEINTELECQSRVE